MAITAVVLPYAPLCEGALYVRNQVKGHATSLERATDFERHAWELSGPQGQVVRTELAPRMVCLDFVVLRAAVLWTAFDRVAMPVFELYPMGTIARTLLD